MKIRVEFGQVMGTEVFQVGMTLAAIDAMNASGGRPPTVLTDLADGEYLVVSTDAQVVEPGEGLVIRRDENGEWPWPIMDFERTADPTTQPFVQVVEDRAWNVKAGAYLMIPLDALEGGQG